MKRTVLCAALLVGLLVPAGAGASVEHPAIGEAAAFERTQSYLAKTYPGWRSRKYGYIDCRRGRINAYIFSCAVGWIRGYNCWQGRTRVENEYAEEGVVYYGISINTRRC